MWLIERVIGSGPEFGDWQAEKAVALQWNEGHVWSVDLDLEPGSYEFKCITAAGDHIAAWENGVNRIVQVPNGVRAIRVDGSWCRTSENRITVTEPLTAASVAARQKRAAAARLLSKALAEVSAAAAASPPSAAVVEARKAAASVKRPDGSKAAAAAELEREAKEALRELGELLSSDIAGVESSLSLTRVRKADKAGPGAEVKSSSRSAAETKSEEAGASSTNTSAKASKSASWRELLSEEQPKQEKEQEQAKEQPAEGQVVAAASSVPTSLLEASGKEGEALPKQAEQAAKPAPAATAEANAAAPSSDKAESEVPDRWAFVKAAAAAPAAAPAGESKPAADKADASKAEPAKAVSSAAPAAPVKEQLAVASPAAAEVAAVKPAAPATEAVEAAGKSAAAKSQEKPAEEAKAEKQPEQKKAPDSSSGVSRFGGLLAKLGGSLGLAQQPEEAKSSKAQQPEAAKSSKAQQPEAAKSSKAQLPEAAKSSKAQQPEAAKSSKAEAAPASSATATAPASVSSTGTSPASSSSSTSSSASSGGRRFSWRSLGDEGDEGKKQEEQKARVAEVQPAEPEAAVGDAKQPEQEEDTASRFARLLKAKQQKAGGGSSAVAASESPKEEKPAAAEKKPEPAAVAEPARKEEQKKDEKAVGEAKQQQEKAGKAVAAAEPKEKSSGAAVGANSTTAAEPDTAAMGANNSKQIETVQDEGLDRLIKVWDSAWSKGKKETPAAAPDSAADAPSTSSSAPAPAPAPTSSGGRRNWASLDADEGPSTSAAGSGKQAQRAGISAALGPAAAAAAKNANGGTPPIGSGSGGAGGSSSESLFTIAERLTSAAPAATPTAVPDDASPDVTMRKGALAAMQVDRQGSYDNRSSFLSQSLLQESLAGGSNGTAGGNGNAAGGGADGPSSSTLLQKLRAANAARGAGVSGSAANGSAANGTFVPPLPATPAPPGILSNDDDDDGGMVPPLPATPPPPSYLTGPSGGKGAPMGDMGPVPPLPATPVASSVLGGADNGGSEKGKGGGAEELLRRAHDADAVLAMLRGNLPLTPIARGGRGGAGAGPLSMADAEEGEDDDDDGSVGHSRKPVEPHPQADPVAATQRAIADAVQAWDKTRAALAALQQSAAELGLSPGAIQEQAAKLLQNMPRAIGTDGNAGNPNANGQPNAIPMTAQLGNLMTGLGLSATSIAEQLTRKSLDGSEQGGGGGGGLGLISGLLGGLTGNSPLPPGCVRLVAGAHMIPHVDKVDKGGEDAYFISRVGLGGVGVADGVSGWADEGIDPAEYPRTLMRYATDAYEAARGKLSAQDIIRYAQYRTYLKGSSTVCLALMKPNKQLEIANVGDSGVRILRNGKVIFGTEAQQHAFNMPFQLSHPNNVEDPDSADDADVHLVEVQDGDVIMLATDGLFDNVFDDEIEQIVSHQLRELASQGRGKAPSAPMSLMSIGAGPPLPEITPTSAASNGSASAATGSSGSAGNAAAGAVGGGTGAARPRGAGLLSQSLNAAAAGAGAKPGTYRSEDAARVARALAERAHLHARNPTQRTPWSVTSSQQPNFMWAKFFAKGGGKMDDCTVLVAFVCSE
eukprot:XP_001697518.1 predicted protein [Chlamydomonas reinhardtii]